MSRSKGIPDISDSGISAASHPVVSPGREKKRQKSYRFTLTCLSLLFVISGSTGLLTEQIFEKMLSALLGSSTPAAAIVLSTYFAGISLGAIAYSRLLQKKLLHPLRIYAFLELGIGLWSLLLYFLFDLLVPVFAPLLRPGIGHPYLLGVLRVLPAALWILPPTFLMGATFPAMVDFLQQSRLRNASRTIAFFYAFNLVGAVLASIAGPYVLFPRIGLDQTLIVCFALDSTVFILALRFSGTMETRQKRVTPTIIGHLLQPSQMWLLIGVAGLSGFLFFSLEILWVHLISAVLGNSIYSFSIMLGIVLAGLCAGGFIAATLFASKKYSNASFPGVLMIAGSVILFIIQPHWDGVPHNFVIWGGSLETFAQGQVLQWIQASLMLFAPATILGIVFPILFRLKVFDASRKEDVVGRMIAANSIASVAGAMITGFVLIPLIGSWTTLEVISASYAIAGLALAFTFGVRKKRFLPVLLSVIAFVLVLNQKPWDKLKLTSGEHVYFRPAVVVPGTKLLFFHEDTYGGITTVVQNGTQTQSSCTLLTNGKFQGSDTGERAAQIGFALIPALFTSHQSSGLVIGLGTGQSADVLQKMNFRKIDIVEIAPGIVEAASKYFGHINGRIVEQQNVSVHIEDGRNFLLLRPNKYDLITMEISSVWFAGSTNLYSREFYQLVKQRLNDKGIFQQWIQIHHISIMEVITAVATLRSVFPYVSFWIFGDQGILVASNSAQVLQALPMHTAANAVKELNSGKYASTLDLASLLGGRILASEDVTEMFVLNPPSVLNTDRNRRFEYFTPRYNLDRRPLAAMNRSVLLRFSGHHPFPYTPQTDPQTKAIIERFNQQPK